MKKGLFIGLFAVILCGTTSVAQNKQEEFEKLVDYVNCYYTVNYFSNTNEIKNGGHKKFFDTYRRAFNSVESYSEIKEVRIDKTDDAATAYNSLRTFASWYKNSSGKLWEYINDKKKQFNDNWTKSEMIDFLILLSDEDKQIANIKNKIGSDAIKTLESKLQNQVSDNLFPNTKTTASTNTTTIKEQSDLSKQSPDTRSLARTRTSRDTTNTDTANETSDTKTFKFDSRFFLLVFVIICLLVCIIVGLKFWDRIKRRKKIVKIFFGLIIILILILLYILFKPIRIIVITAILILVIIVVYRIMKRDKNNEDASNETEKTGRKSDKKYKELKDQFDALNRDYDKLKKENDTLKRNSSEILKEWERKYKELERQKSNPSVHPTVEPKDPFVIPPKVYAIPEEQQTETSASTLYADAIVDGVFNRIETEVNVDTVYEITKTSTRNATFRIYTNAYKRVIECPDFVDGCDKQRINPAPQTLEVENGETMQDDFGKWKITKKAKIKFV